MSTVQRVSIFIKFLFISSQFHSIVSFRAARIASGYDAKITENLDFVSLNVFFENQSQKCGGSLIAAQYVLTSATCLYDPVEGTASIVNVTFPQLKTPVEFVNTKLKIYLHPSYSAATHADDIAIVKLMKPMVPDGKTLAIANLETNATADMYVDEVLRACGFGSTTNYPRYSKTLQCTELFGVHDNNCSTNANIICTQWSDRDNNICSGDYGSPLYYIPPEGVNFTQTVVGIASYSPDYRPVPRYREWDLKCKVYVGNLDQRATKHQIEDIFSKYGPLRNVWVARNPPGFAFVEYEDNRDAEDAVRNLDGSRACGTRIRVEMSNGRTRNRSGGGGGGGGNDRRRNERSGRYRSRSRSRSARRSSPVRRSRRSRSRSEERRSDRSDSRDRR